VGGELLVGQAGLIGKNGKRRIAHRGMVARWKRGGG
jgi:hypothetical protein